MVAAAAIGAAVSLKAFDAAVKPLIDRYAQYNPEIAIAQAMAEVRNVFGDMRRANQIGPELSRYVEVRSQLEQEWKDVEIKILTALLPIATEGLQILRTVVSGLNTLSGGLGPISDGVGAMPGLVQIVVRILRLLQNEVQNQDQTLEPRSIVVPNL